MPPSHQGRRRGFLRRVAAMAAAGLCGAGIVGAQASSPELEGDAQYRDGHYLAAIRLFESVQPATPMLLDKTGVAAEHMLLFDKARASFEAAIKLRPDFAAAWNNLGTVYHAAGDLHHAEKCYSRAIKLDPKNADALQNLGTALYAERKFKKGDEAYRKAVALDPGILERSARHGIQSTSSTQNRAEMHYHMACTYAAAGHTELALEMLRRCVLEGFHDRNRALHEKQFQEIRTNEGFLKLIDDMRQN